MKTDQPNLIIHNVLTKREIDAVYDHIAKTPIDRTNVMESLGHRAYYSWLPQEVVDKLTAQAQSTTDRIIELRELSFARYSAELNPRLHPHLDTVFKEPRLTFDVQVGGNVSWPITVEGKDYVLKNNEALTFAGTHQIHWRPKMKFEPGQYLDMIFCHFSAVGDEPESLGDDHYLPLQARCDKLEEIYNES